MALFLTSRAKVAGVSFGLFCFSLFLTAYSAKNPQISKFGYAFLAEIQRPFQIMNIASRNSISDFWNSYINLIRVKDTNDILSKRVSALEALNATLIENRMDNITLKKLLGVSEEHKITGVAAEIIGYDPNSLSQIAVLDKGSLNGVKVGQPVIVDNGAVGQISEVSPNTARVVFITDPASGVDAIIQETRVRGVVRGTGKINSCKLQYVLREDEVKVGDKVITSGMDSIFPKGMLIGIVGKVENKATGMFQTVDVRPLVNFNKIETVLVVNKDLN